MERTFSIDQTMRMLGLSRGRILEFVRDGTLIQDADGERIQEGSIKRFVESRAVIQRPWKNNQ